MNESRNSLNPIRDDLDFPAVISSGAVQQQASYRGGKPNETQSQDTDALISLVQDLNQQNHDFLHRIALLEEELAAHQRIVSTQLSGLSGASEQSVNIESSNPDFLRIGQGVEEGKGGDHGQVSHLLNHLEFAQQANQRQSIRIESLTAQLDSSQSRIDQLEMDNTQLSQRCSEQVCHLNRLEEECRDLRLRLQRQQQYTLQFKAALERCLEVPPPSYSIPHPDSDFTVLQDSPEWRVESMEPMQISSSLSSSPLRSPVTGEQELVDSGKSESADSNWWVHPLFPKVQRIRSWAETQEVSDEMAFASLSEGEDREPLPRLIEKEQVCLPLVSPANFGELEAPLWTSRPDVRDRFQSNLRSLVYEKQINGVLGEQVGDSEIGDGKCCADRVGMLESHDSSINDQSHNAWSRQMALDEIPETIAPFPRISSSDDLWESKIKTADNAMLSSPSDDLTKDVGSDERLWQSLVNLVDLSATDGLDLPLHPARVQLLRDSENQASCSSTSGSSAFSRMNSEVGELSERSQLSVMDSPQVAEANQQSDRSPGPSLQMHRVIDLPHFLPPKIPHTSPSPM